MCKGAYNLLGSNTIVTNCSLPSPGYYVFSKCNSTSDTVILPCTSNVPNGYYVSTICSAGSLNTLGSDIKTRACTTTANSNYNITTPCSVGNYSSLGSNTVVSCSVGFFGIVNSTSTVASNCTMCSSPLNGYYTKSPCSSISNTVIASCSNPSSSSYYVNATCIAGSWSSKGQDTSFGQCVAPTGYFNVSSCISGNYNTLGSFSFSSCDIGYYGIPNVTIGSWVISGCSPCPLSFYCPRGTTNYIPCSSPLTFSNSTSIGFYTTGICTPI